MLNIRFLTFINLQTNLDPLEQFEVIYFPFLKYFLYTNLSYMMTITLLCFGGLLSIFLYSNYNVYSYMVKNAFNLVENILNENLYIKRQIYFTNLFYLFFIILLCNLLGLIPYSFTVTSSFIVTFFLSLSHFLGLNLVGMFQSK